MSIFSRSIEWLGTHPKTVGAAGGTGFFAALTAALATYTEKGRAILGIDDYTDEQATAIAESYVDLMTQMGGNLPQNTEGLMVADNDDSLVIGAQSYKVEGGFLQNTDGEQLFYGPNDQLTTLDSLTAAERDNARVAFVFQREGGQPFIHNSGIREGDEEQMESLLQTMAQSEGRGTGGNDDGHAHDRGGNQNERSETPPEDTEGYIDWLLQDSPLSNNYVKTGLMAAAAIGLIKPGQQSLMEAISLGGEMGRTFVKTGTQVGLALGALYIAAEVIGGPGTAEKFLREKFGSNNFNTAAEEARSMAEEAALSLPERKAQAFDDFLLTHASRREVFENGEASIQISISPEQAAAMGLNPGDSALIAAAEGQLSSYYTAARKSERLSAQLVDTVSDLEAVAQQISGNDRGELEQRIEDVHQVLAGSYTKADGTPQQASLASLLSDGYKLTDYDVNSSALLRGAENAGTITLKKDGQELTLNIDGSEINRAELATAVGAGQNASADQIELSLLRIESADLLYQQSVSLRERIEEAEFDRMEAMDNASDLIPNLAQALHCAETSVQAEIEAYVRIAHQGDAHAAAQALRQTYFENTGQWLELECFLSTATAHSSNGVAELDLENPANFTTRMATLLEHADENASHFSRLHDDSSLLGGKYRDELTEAGLLVENLATIEAQFEAGDFGPGNPLNVYVYRDSDGEPHIQIGDEPSIPSRGSLISTVAVDSTERLESYTAQLLGSLETRDARMEARADRRERRDAAQHSDAGARTGWISAIGSTSTGEQLIDAADELVTELRANPVNADQVRLNFTELALLEPNRAVRSQIEAVRDAFMGADPADRADLAQAIIDANGDVTTPAVAAAVDNLPCPVDDPLAQAAAALAGAEGGTDHSAGEPVRANNSPSTGGSGRMPQVGP